MSTTFDALRHPERGVFDESKDLFLYSMKLITFLILTLFLLIPLIFPSSVSAASVVINEFLVNPSGLDTNEWIELYSSDPNFSSPDYWIDDDNALLVNNAVQTGSDDHGSDPVHLALDFQGNNFFVIPLSSYLNNNGDHPALFLFENQTEVLVDDYNYSTDPGDDVSFGRWPDGGSWAPVLSSATKGSANNPPLSPSLTLTLIPTQTPSPTKAPSPTKTLTPTKTPTPSRTPTPEVIPTNTPTVSSITSPVASPKSPTKKPTPAVLGEKTSEPDPTINLDVIDATSQETATPTGELMEASQEEGAGKKTGTTLPFILIVIGAILTLGFGTPLVIHELRARRK